MPTRIGSLPSPPSAPSSPPTPYKNDSPNSSPSPSSSHRSVRSLPSIDVARQKTSRPSTASSSSSKTIRPLPTIPGTPNSAMSRRSVRPLPLPPPPQSAPPTMGSSPGLLGSARPFTRRTCSAGSVDTSCTSQRDRLSNPWPHTFEDAELPPLDGDSFHNPWPQTLVELPEDRLEASLTKLPEINSSPMVIPDILFDSPSLSEPSSLDFSSDAEEDDEDSNSDTNTSEPQSSTTSLSKPVLLRLDTKNVSLLRADSKVSSVISPYSPGFPVPPTPQTAERNRLRKLRRFLGESLPADAVSAPFLQEGKQKILQDISNRRGRDVDDTANKYSQAAIIVTKILEMSSDDEDEDLSDGEEDGTGLFINDKRSTGQYTTGSKDDYNWVLENGYAFKAASKRRFSRKWMHEKGESRWEEPDYEHVINALRAL